MIGQSVWTIVVAGGSGSRFGGLKQLQYLGDTRIVDRSVATARLCSTGVVLVVPAGYESEYFPGADEVVVGGATRADSVRAGLGRVPASATVIVVHDAARPLASKELFESVIGAVAAGAAGAIPGVPVADTLKRVGPGPGGSRVVIETVDREQLVAVQTPQGFDAAALRLAHRSGDVATDDAALVESCGGTVVIVEGDLANFKVTVPSDIEMANAVLGGVPAR